MQTTNRVFRPHVSRLHTSSRISSNSLPASFMRGGTSKGIYLKAEDVPDQNKWPDIFSKIMGSPDPYGRQLNGMGGGISSLSKICVVDKSQRPGIDIDYTFVQVGIKDKLIDLTGNCGNLSSGIAPFALHAGLVNNVPSGSNSITLSLFNTNTSKTINATFPVKDGKAHLADNSNFSIDGVPGTASRITLDFLSPGGARTGKLFPTGNPVDIITLPNSNPIRITLMDCTNPTVYINSSDIDVPITLLPDHFDSATLETLEYIRQKGASLMGLDPEAQAQPKIAMVGPPCQHKLISGKSISQSDVDLVIRAISMQQPHRAVPMTVAMATGAAARIKGTIVWETANRVNGDEVRLGHPSGTVSVGADINGHGEVLAAKVYRTARMLMSGHVYW